MTLLFSGRQTVGSHSNKGDNCTLVCTSYLQSMIVGFTTTCVISAYNHYSGEFEPRSWLSVLDKTFCNKVCQWLATDGWLSTGWVLWFFSPIKLTSQYNWNIVESGVKHHKPHLPTDSWQFNKSTKYILSFFNYTQHFTI